MHTMIFKLLALAVGVAAAPTTTTCDRDNCLRAVAASAFPTRLGTSDCSSYFLTTVTPATSTQTVTITTSPTQTLQATVTNTGTVTDVATITNTATVITDQTVTNTATEIDTLTDTIIISLTTTITAGGPDKRRKRNIAGDVRVPEVTLARRQVTVAPSAIPSYASACSGSVRYSSACSCLGVTKSTITAATPITTITVTATNVQSLTLTQTNSATATDLVTETDSATATSVITETNVVTATVDVSKTISETVVATFTQTAVNCGPTGSFILQGVGTGTSDDGQYLQLVSANDGLNDDVLVFVSDPAAATVFNIDAAGHLNANGYYANIEAGVQHFLFYFNTPSDISTYGYVYATCSLSTTGELDCSDQGSTLFQISPSVASSGTGGAGVVIGQFIEQGNIPINFQATCVS